MPGAGVPSTPTLSVAVQGWPAFGATSAAVIVMFRSFASAAGAATRAASTANTLSLRILPPWSACIHRPRGSGSTRRARGTAAEDPRPRAGQLEEHGGRVVRIRTLAQHAVWIGAVHEHEQAAEAGDVDRLALLPRGVVVAEARRDSLPDRNGSRPASCALARPHRRTVQGPRLVGVAEAETGLVIATDEAAVETPQLVPLEAGEVPMPMCLGLDVAEPDAERPSPPADHLPGAHLRPDATRLDH